MSQGSTCPECGYHSEKLLITCPRCRQPMQNDHCKSCGRCPAGKADKNDKGK